MMDHCERGISCPIGKDEDSLDFWREVEHE